MQDQGSWSDCPSGVVTDMAGALRRRKRWAQLQPILAISFAFALVSVVGYGLATRDRETPRASLTCREAAQLFAKYHDRSLETDVANDVRKHLSHCPKCREHYAKQFPSEVRNSLSSEPRLVAVATNLAH